MMLEIDFFRWENTYRMHVLPFQDVCTKIVVSIWQSALSVAIIVVALIILWNYLLLRHRGIQKGARGAAIGMLWIGMGAKSTAVGALWDRKGQKV